MKTNKEVLKNIAIAITFFIVATISFYEVFYKEASPEPESDSNEKGYIEGSLSYGGEHIPEDIKVCAENLETNEQYCTNQHIKDSKYKYSTGYIIEAPPGDYYVFATTNIMGDNRKAYYNEHVTCGKNYHCTSKEKIIVTVNSNKTIKGIDPHDWKYDQ